MLEQVKKILSKYTDAPNIEPQSTLEADLGLPSFDVVEIVTEFEEEFGIEISDRDIGKFVCVGDILEYVERTCSGNQ